MNASGQGPWPQAGPQITDRQQVSGSPRQEPAGRTSAGDLLLFLAGAHEESLFLAGGGHGPPGGEEVPGLLLLSRGKPWVSASLPCLNPPGTFSLLSPFRGTLTNAMRPFSGRDTWISVRVRLLGLGQRAPQKQCRRSAGACFLTLSGRRLAGQHLGPLRPQHRSSARRTPAVPARPVGRAHVGTRLLAGSCRLVIRPEPQVKGAGTASWPEGGEGRGGRRGPEPSAGIPEMFSCSSYLSRAAEAGGEDGGSWRPHPLAPGLFSIKPAWPRALPSCLRSGRRGGCF